MIKRRLTALGANIFAGGFTLGVRKHFDVLGHLEHDDYGAETARLNLGVEVVTQQPAWHAHRFRGKVDFVYSNPPCAVWSVLGVNHGERDWRDDPRLERIKDIFALIEAARPRAWCWESVCQAFVRGREFVDTLVTQAAAMGYSSTFVFVDARWHGIPQSRKRFFLVCHDVEIEWRAPRYVEARSAAEVIASITPKTVQDTTRWNKEANLVLRRAKQGESLRKAYDRLHGDDYEKTARGRAHGRMSFHFKRMREDGPIGTVTGPHIVHYKEPRLLSVEELAALCGFPRSFKLPPKMRHDPASRLLARGVMPPVGEWLAANVAAAIRRNRKVKAPATWYADFRTPPGRVEPAATYERAAAPRERVQRVPGAPKAPRQRQAPVDYDRMVLPKPERDAPRATSGAFIRHHLVRGRYSYEEIAALVRRTFEGRTTTVADVYYQRNKLRQEGVVAPERVRRPIRYQETA